MADAINENHVLDTLERIESELQNANTIEKLKQFLSEHFEFLLNRLISRINTIRCKSMGILIRLSQIIQLKNEIQVNVELVLQYFNNFDGASIFPDFLAIFVKIGYPRLLIQSQFQLAPLLLDCIEAKKELHHDKLLMLLMPLIATLRDEPDKLKGLFNFHDKPFTKKLFLSLSQEILLLTYGTNCDTNIPPPGLSFYMLKCLTENNWDDILLENIKISIIWLLCNTNYNGIDSLIPLVLGSLDKKLSVSSPAINELKHMYAAVDVFISADILRPLHELFSQNDSESDDHKRYPFSKQIRSKLEHKVIKFLERKLGDKNDDDDGGDDDYDNDQNNENNQWFDDNNNNNDIVSDDTLGL